MQIFAQVVSLAIAAVGIAMFVRAIRRILAVLRTGQPAKRSDNPGARALTMLKETLGHTRMLQWTWVGAGHWFVFVGFGLLFFTLLTAFGQLFDPHFALPLVGHFFLYEWVTELFTFVMIIAIVAFICYRATRPKERVRGPRGRFFGSTMWQGYFVEAVILGVGLCIATLRGLEYALLAKGGEHAENASALHFPFFFWLGELLSGLSTGTIENLIYLVAMLKIVISFTWMIVISRTPTMGVAWHRFLAFFNIFFKRESSGRTALGAVKPMTAGGEVVSFEDLEDMDEDTVLGVGKAEDFSWKGILDFTTCTECGRCQSQCPAWNTEKPLSPKLLITGLRDHAHAKASYLLADESERASLPGGVLTEAERPLVGATEGDWAWDPTGGAVIDDDVLWSCTSCGACVQQCPVDIEHVDHIVDMRRYQVLVESNFPAELNGLFRGLENKGNPWNMAPTARLEWAQGLDFDVKVVGEDVESLDEVEWLFWVGCAGAYEDRAKKTTRAVAELLNLAGVEFAVLGNGETCTGDPARRAGNEFVFQGLATQNAELFKETKAKKVVSTCAHCFNTLKNEYAQFGVELEVVHHTQLLNRLVREKKLTPVAGSGGGTRSITYHDPCYLGRHNQVYSPPRELLAVLPDAEVKEMPRNSERSFCCGAGGARMWMEENIGERINVNRTKEAVETGADQIAVGCPFCRVMLSDGLTAQQSKGEAREEVEVLDVAQLLLASVKGESAAPAAKSTPPAPKPAAAKSAAAPAASAAAVDSTETPEPTVEPTPEPAPAGGSLFDAAPAEPAKAEPSSLFDVVDDQATQAEAVATEPAPAIGGSLFDIAEPEQPANAASTPKAKDAAQPSDTSSPGPTTEVIPEGGSLFDLAEPEEAPAVTPEPTASAGEAPETPPPTSSATPGTVIPEGGSLFDLAEPEEAPAVAAPQAGTGPDGPADEPDDGQVAGRTAAEAEQIRTLREIKDRLSAPEPAAEPAAEPATAGAESAVEDGETDEAPAEEQATPPSGEKHQPRTDIDITESGSLFDL